MDSHFVPGPRRIPLLGHLPQYWRDPLGFIVRCAHKYGDVVRLHLGKTTLLLTNPEDIQHVLVTHSERYAKTLRISGDIGRRWLGNSILTTLGDEHLRRRRTLQPSFVPKAVEAFATLIANEAHTWVSARRNGERLDIAEHMRDLSQRIMTRMLFGSVDDTDGALFRAIRTRRLYHEHIVGAVLSMPQYQPSRVLFKYVKAARHIDAVLMRVLQSKRSLRGHSNDMISGWMHTRYDDGSPMSDAEIRAEALNIIDTGYETISAALAWTWYLLAQHRHVEERMIAELRDALRGNLPQAGDIQKLPYTAAVLKESLRLYPPTWSFARTALKPDVLPCGVQVDAGTKLFLCQYIVQRSARYFNEPETFRPERFLEARDSNMHRFTYFPFGGGTHQCLGESFAELECVLVLAVLAERFRFDVESKQDVQPSARFALRPKNGIRVTAIMRQPKGREV